MNELNLSRKKLIIKLWRENNDFLLLLKKSETLQQAREKVFNFLNDLERDYFNIYSKSERKKMHSIEKNNAKECIRVMKNIIRTENEALTKFSSLNYLFKLAHKEEHSLNTISAGFLCEFLYLLRGIKGKSKIDQIIFDTKKISGNSDELTYRSKRLDKYSKNMISYFGRYKSGLEDDLIKKRSTLKKKILKYFNASEKEWNDYHWQLKNIINNLNTLKSLVNLSQEEIEGLNCAKKFNISFQITPYYLSLFENVITRKYDYCIRAQVLPSVQYCFNVKKKRESGLDLDFMGEKFTSPIDCITRRYAQIVILKPFDSCPQICVYCQRNWEIKSINEAKITKKKIILAINWIKNNENISEVLITGGDPLTLNNEFIEWIISNLSKINHIERIRIGTRTIVTLPFRINFGLIKILKKYHELGKREICIITHFEHPTEITPDAVSAIKKIKKAGINIYNQQVFTFYNSKKFETCYLRKILKLCGIDPYYSFNAKGKEETIDFRVPIARIEQERKEEARLLPGIVRTDEPVFNVPMLGKSHLRAWQDHEPIMIFADGRRAYRFYPWESKLTTVDTFIYKDVSIYSYLKKIQKYGELINDYKTIWYYY